MKKAVNKKQVACGNHEFALTPMRADLYYKTQVTLSFCDSKPHPKPKGKKKSGVEVNCLCCPIFNKDGSYATNTFILPDEKQNYLENQVRYKEEHEYRINEGNHEKSQMLFPRPKTKHNHCNVCRSSYEDYRDHIKSESHKINIRKSSFNKTIKQMEDKYNTLNQGRNYRSKICSNVETTQNGSLEDQQITNLGAPSKRIKRDCSFVPPICYTIPPLPMVQNDMQTFSPFPLVSQQNPNQQCPLSYVPFLYPQVQMLSQNQLLSMIQANMYQQFSLNSQMTQPMFLGFPNMFFNETQDPRSQQGIFNASTAVERSLVNNS